MPRCINANRRKKQICTGDLDTLITIQGRSITPPASGVDATETFTTENLNIWAMLETGKGTVFFDDTNIEKTITHEFSIVFISGLTAENWVLFEGRRFDTLMIEDFDERHEYQLLRCNERGTTSNETNEA